MKHQQNQLASKRNFIRIAALVVMLVLMVCCTVIFANAEPAPISYTGSHDHMPATGDTGFRFDESLGKWVKTYDGNDGVGDRFITVNIDGEKIIARDIVFMTAKGEPTANVGEAVKIRVTYQVPGEEEARIDYLPAEIRPKELSWDGEGTATTTYNPQGIYNDVKVVLGNSVKLVGALKDDQVAFDRESITVDFSAQGLVTKEDGVYAVAQVSLTNENKNYYVAPLKVKVIVNQAEIVEIVWQGGDTISFADDFTTIKAVGKLADGSVIPMTVLVDSMGMKVPVTEIAAAGEYKLTAVAPNALYKVAKGVSVNNTLTVTKATYTVVLNDGEFVTSGQLLNPGVAFSFQLVAEGKDGERIPDWVLSSITYEYTNEQGKKVKRVTEPGVYTVKVVAPKLSTADIIVEKGTATMTVIANYKVLETPDGSIVVVSNNGIPSSVEAKLSIPEELARITTRGLHVYKAYTLNLSNIGDLNFSVRIPVSTAFSADKNCYPLSAGNLYIVDADGNRVVASEKYSVTLSEDGFYYIIDGYTTTGDVTFLIAPEYDTPFWASAIGIALIVLIALILIVIIPLIIGFVLIRIEDSGRNPVISVELQGILPDFEPVVIPDKIEDPDAIIEEGLDAKVEDLYAEISADIDTDVDAGLAVAEAKAELDEELAQIDLMAEANAAADELVDQFALDMLDAEMIEDTEVSEEVQDAVASAMAENFNESADATDAIALVEEEEVAEEANEEESDDDDDDDSFGGFGSMPLDYIDAIADADRYAEMLAQESRGEVQLVTRYRRSYLSRLAQSQGSIQEYYNAIKNLLLSYKGVKCRTSWNFESFNVGRTPLAKFNAKTRTLYVYIAFSPEELVDSKYNFTDMSAKKKYAAVPVLIKVKGERKFKHALELITMLCEEKLQLPKKKNFEEVDYKMPFKTTEELVNEGIIKKMVAAIPVGPVAEEVVVEETPVEEVVEETVAGDDQNA